MTNYKKLYRELYADVVMMLVSFRDNYNEHHGTILLSDCDRIRSKYDKETQ